MNAFKRTALGVAVAAALAAGAAQAQVSDNVIKIGVLSDMSSLYTDLAGAGSVVAARMAVEDSGIEKRGYKVEFVSADHQNKPDVGSAIARQWYDTDKVDVIVDVPNSGVALAVNQITKEKGKAFLASGPASSDLTGKACTPNTVHWTYDTWMLANGTGGAIVKSGGDTWFFITADYAFGHALERDTAAIVTKNGGKVVGSVKVPLNNQDFSSFLLQAQASKAKIVGLANAGGDTTNSIKQAAEFGIVKGGQNLAGLLVFLTDVHALGLPTAQGLIVTNTFYWDQNDQTRAFAKRFAERDKGIHPTMVHAGVYSSVLHYLKAVEALKSDDGTKVVAKMKEMPTDDPLFGKGTIRVDGRKIHPAYLVEVKKPAESKGPWDYYKVRATIPADQAFRPLKDGSARWLSSRVGPARRPRPHGRGLAGKGRFHEKFSMEIFGIPTQALFGQLLIGLINGAFYAMLSLGLAVIFGLLNIINFTHGAQYMMGAFCAWFLLEQAGIGYWWSLLIAPIAVGLTGIVIERTMLSRLYKLDHLYGLLLTFGLALIIQGLFTNYYGSSGQPYRLPTEFAGTFNLGFMFLPKYRAWVIVASLVVCLATWFVIERTKLGSYLRAATENPSLVQAFGINVPRMITLTYGFGVGLAALAGVMAAPIYQVSPQMGANLIIVVFAVVVIGGMGSILGAILTGFGLGIVEGLTKVFYPEASNTVIFVIMVLVLLVKPAGLFGKER